MGGVGGELAFGCKAACHAVRGTHELLGDQVNFFDTGLIEVRAHVPGTDLFCGGGQIDEGRGQAPGHAEGQEQAGSQRDDDAHQHKR